MANNTIVTYLDGSISSYSIVGELKNETITYINDAVAVDIGTDVTSIGFEAF